MIDGCVSTPPQRREHMAELKEQVAKALTDENYELGRTCIFSAHWPSPPPPSLPLQLKS